MAAQRKPQGCEREVIDKQLQFHPQIEHRQQGKDQGNDPLGKRPLPKRART